jgi:hypothetical protein
MVDGPGGGLGVVTATANTFVPELIDIAAVTGSTAIGPCRGTPSDRLVSPYVRVDADPHWQGYWVVLRVTARRSPCRPLVGGGAGRGGSLPMCGWPLSLTRAGLALRQLVQQLLGVGVLLPGGLA